MIAIRRLRSTLQAYRKLNPFICVDHVSV